MDKAEDKTQYDVGAGEALSTEQIHALLLECFGEDVVHEIETGPTPHMVIEASGLLGVLAFLKDQPELRMDFLEALSGVDHPEKEQIALVYQLDSYYHLHTAAVKVLLPRSEPTVESASGLWACARWYERECYDLMGVHFTGHPDLRRLLLPDEYPGHPLLKDFEEPEEVLGMTTSREDPMEVLAKLS